MLFKLANKLENMWNKPNEILPQLRQLQVATI
jgi:hypothetical protein